jgi:hypothetical protein
MSDALRYLLDDAKRYLLIINRSPINPENGEKQDVNITLFENDPPSLANPLDSRLKHSRKIIIVLIQKDGGAAKLDLTRRSWEMWTKSPSLHNRLHVFNEKLRSSRRSRLFTINGALTVGLLPIWSALLLGFAWSAFSQEGRREVWSGPAKANIPFPVWLKHYNHDAGRLWPIFIIAALAIWIIILTSGGLRIWPNYLSRHSFDRAAYHMRSNFILPENLNAPLFVGIAGVVLGAIVTVLLTRYLG